MKKDTENTASESTAVRTSGFCKKCGREHWLGPGNTRHHCRKLMHQLNRLGTIDLFSTGPGTNLRQETATELETAPLFGPSRGKMFGVLECLKPDGIAIFLHAFSGQYNGVWLVDGWVPPLFEIDEFLKMTFEREKKIKQLGAKIDLSVPHSHDWLMHRKERRQLSQRLMQDIHSLYRLSNFRGKTATLREAFISNNGIPTGTGDCCAPKLLNFAAKNNLIPMGISEFFWGRENKSGDHRHGSFTSACAEKCQPILGFMLCGLDELENT
jgi:hypothetical protein